jgi:hypothetical protein
LEESLNNRLEKFKREKKRVKSLWEMLESGDDETGMDFSRLLFLLVAME